VKQVRRLSTSDVIVIFFHWSHLLSSNACTRVSGGNGVCISEQAIRHQLFSLKPDHDGLVLHSAFELWLRTFVASCDDVNFARIIAALMYDAGLPSRLAFDAPQWNPTVCLSLFSVRMIVTIMVG
jgi:hypothetical protein